MDICNELQIISEQLLTGKGTEDEEEIAAASPESKFTLGDIQMIEDYHNLREEQQKRLMAYMEAHEVAICDFTKWFIFEGQDGGRRKCLMLL